MLNLLSVAIFGATLQNLVYLPKYIDMIYTKGTTHPYVVPNFSAGVASGDPTLTSIILWSRIGNFNGDVDILISTNDKFTRPIIHTTATDYTHDYIVKIDATNLTPDTKYFYKFSIDYNNTKLESPVGITKTLPTNTAHLKVAVASCADYPNGFFTSYRVMVILQADIVVFLGDYIYEYANKVYGDGTTINRIPNPDQAIITLEDYRKRHLQYKQDKDIQYLHQNIPMIPVWDDHEFSDNSWREGSKDLPEIFKRRKLAAMQAYFEYIPIRVFPEEMFKPIYRTFQFGNLFELIMLDTRSMRDQTDITNPVRVGNPNRTILGTEQEAWLTSLPVKEVEWTLIGNQIVFGVFAVPIHKLHLPILSDAWDAYPASRAFLLNFLKDRRQKSGATPIILSGDIHISMHNQIDGINEFVTPAISSPNIEGAVWGRLVQALFNGVAGYGDFKWANVREKGFVMLDIYSNYIETKWVLMDDIKKDKVAYSIGKSMIIQNDKIKNRKAKQ